MPSPGSMPSFEEIKEILGFNNYYEEEKRYATNITQFSAQRGNFSGSNNESNGQGGKEQEFQTVQDRGVEVFTPEVLDKYVADYSKGAFSGIWSRKLRVKITGGDGFEKLDIRIPAGFLDGITNIVPALGGVNIKQLLDNAALEEGGKVLLDFDDTMGDRIQVILE